MRCKFDAFVTREAVFKAYNKLMDDFTSDGVTFGLTVDIKSIYFDESFYESPCGTEYNNAELKLVRR